MNVSALPSTLREKIGQMILVGFRGCTPAECSVVIRDLREHHIGSVILFDQEMAASAPGRRNIESPAQVKALIAHLQAQARGPLLVAVDQEGGRVNRLKPAAGFPESISHEELGRLDQTEETFRHAAATARTLAELGFNLNLAPVVDLDAHPDNPIIKGKGRSFSSDPEAVARHAAAFVRAHRAAGVLCCAKHFPGHGSATGDTHLGLVDVTATWHERELIPFCRLIEAGLGDVEMESLRFELLGDTALDIGRCKMLVPVAMGKRREERGKYLIVMTRQTGAEWKIIADSWSSDSPVNTLLTDSGAKRGNDPMKQGPPPSKPR